MPSRLAPFALPAIVMSELDKLRKTSSNHIANEVVACPLEDIEFVTTLAVATKGACTADCR